MNGWEVGASTIPYGLINSDPSMIMNISRKMELSTFASKILLNTLIK